MRASLVTYFYDTLDYCLDHVLGDLLGSSVRESVYGLLDRNGIARNEISSRFDEVVEVMVRVLGTCSRVIVHRVVSEMYGQYSQRLDFSYQDSLREKLSLLKETILSNHLAPKRHYEGTASDVSEYLRASPAPVHDY